MTYRTLFLALTIAVAAVGYPAEIHGVAAAVE